MKVSFFDFQVFKINSQFNPELKGENKQSMLLLFYSNGKEDIDFLAKVLNAIKMDLDQDTLFIDMPLEEFFPLSDFLKKHRINKVLIFGLSIEKLGIRFTLPKYKLVEHMGVSYLLADPLPLIHEERLKGGKQLSALLWKALQLL